MTNLERDLLLQTLAGYAEVNRITEAERRARLQALTDEEARAIFDDLCAVWQPPAREEADAWRRLDQWRLEQKMSLRQAFVRLAHAKGLV